MVDINEEMSYVLKKLQLTQFIPVFLTEKITADVVCKLSLQEFRQLGVIHNSDIMKLRTECAKYGSYCPKMCKKSNDVGAPKFAISKHFLGNLIDEGFTIKEISKILCVSERTVYCRMAELNLSKRKFTVINNEQLDDIMLKLTKDYPSNGELMLNELLKTKGIKVQRYRLRDCIHRIDKKGIESRKKQIETPCI